MILFLYSIIYIQKIFIHIMINMWTIGNAVVWCNLQNSKMIYEGYFKNMENKSLF